MERKFENNSSSFVIHAKKRKAMQSGGTKIDQPYGGAAMSNAGLQSCEPHPTLPQPRETGLVGGSITDDSTTSARPPVVGKATIASEGLDKNMSLSVLLQVIRDELNAQKE